MLNNYTQSAFRNIEFILNLTSSVKLGTNCTKGFNMRKYEFMFIKYTTLFLLLFLLVSVTKGQDDVAFFQNQEQLMQKDFATLKEVRDDYLLEKAVERIQTQLENALQKPSSFEYDFEALPISKLQSDDGKVRVITWNVPQEDGTHEYFGFVQYKSKNKYRATRLTDASEHLVQPEKMKLKPNQWYGALYYDIITIKSGKRNFYTLLGWDGHSYKMSQKVVEVLGFKASGEPVFGANLFKIHKKTAKRIILRYSSNARVTLKYEKRKKRIIFDHLSPFKPQYAGVYEYYGPDMYHDALVYKKGKWWLDTIVDIKNTKARKQETKVKYSAY